MKNQYPTSRDLFGQETGDFQVMVEEMCESAVNYGRKQPVVLASIIFAVGFYLGWKARPW